MEKYIILSEYENYAVSNLGNVKNIKSGKLIKQVKTPTGYLQVSISKNGKKKSFRVHRLVAIYFIDNPLNKEQVNHKNGDKTDNRVCNLEWTTHTENINHAFNNELIKTKKPVIITNVDTGEEITFESTSECSRFLGVNNGSVNRVLKGKRNRIRNFYVRYL